MHTGVGSRSLYLSAAVLFVAASSVATGQGYSTAFDDVSGWTFTNSSATVGWAVDNTPSTMPGGVFQSSPNSLNYNNGLDYADAVANSGTARSPVLSLGNLSAPVLKFSCNFQTETLSTPYDVRFVRIIEAASGLQHKAVQCAVLSATGEGTCSATGAWHEHTIALNPYWGNVQIEFFFDTIDTIENNFPGWFIDDVSVTGTTSGQTPVVSQNIDFDSGMAPWTLDPAASGVAWDVDALPAAVGASAAPSALSAPKSLNYNDGQDYDNGVANFGGATSPGLSVSNLVAPILVFACNYETETKGISFDKRFVRISNDGFATTLADLQFASVNVLSPEAYCADMGKWHFHTIPLDPAWGNIQIRFTFDTIDFFFNQFFGWAVDNIRIVSFGSPQGGDSGSGGGGVVSGGGSGGSTVTLPAPRRGGDRPAGSALGCSAGLSSGRPMTPGGRHYVLLMVGGFILLARLFPLRSSS